MKSFLLKTNQVGAICEVVWSQPTYFVSAVQRSLFDIFIESDRAALQQAIDQALASKKPAFCVLSHLSDSQDYRFKVCILFTHNNLMAFAYEQGADQCQNIILHFMEHVLIPSEAGNHQATKASINDYEQIQLLNNELVNTRRRLEKVNVQMNRLNQDLNNRLVKDALTGLVSRYQYRTEIEQVIAQNQASLGIFFFIDIDDFKNVNDTYGHVVGDAFLVEFADRLKTFAHNEAMICMRISGDEFGLYLHGLSVVDDLLINKLWLRFQRLVSKHPIKIGGHNIPISCSLGLSVYGQDTSEIYDLIDYADFAMYLAKRNGKNKFCRFQKTEFDLERNTVIK